MSESQLDTPSFGGTVSLATLASKGGEYGAVALLEDGRLRRAAALGIAGADLVVAKRRAVVDLSSLGFLCIYASPMVPLIQLGRDPDAAFWIGRFGLIAYAVPVFVIVMHLLHLMLIARRHTSRRVVFVATAVVPALVFMVAGFAYAVGARHVHEQLSSEGCGGGTTGDVGEKARLQQAYDEAAYVWKSCSQRLFAENGYMALPRRPTLQSCSKEYPYLMTLRNRYGREFEYLGSVEANHDCSGFCTQGPSLWTGDGDGGRSGGTCVSFVALKFLVVEREGRLVFGAGLVALLVSCAAYVVAAPLLERLGFEATMKSSLR